MDSPNNALNKNSSFLKLYLEFKYDIKLFILELELKIFHFEISGNEIRDEQLKNKFLKQVTLFMFHLEISGNEINDLHP